MWQERKRFRKATGSQSTRMSDNRELNLEEPRRSLAVAKGVSGANWSSSRRWGTKLPGLTKLEFEVLRCLLRGGTSEEIGRYFGTSPGAVDIQREAIVQKTKALSLVHLGFIAATLGVRPNPTIKIVRNTRTPH
ncbi:MAG: hypothetical protein EON59_04200 [Alphaproteobacteria bacterium]|nr:MAG: hypothetical protein EON59_04200 [Alphaproteobacteria bacterium]